MVAGVELLIGHQFWLRRLDFVEIFVAVDDSPVSGTPMASLDWEAAAQALQVGRLLCSRSQGQVLRVAASIAEGVPVDLRDAVSGLDEHNLALVAGAVLRAGGCQFGLGAVAGDQARWAWSR